MIDGIIAESPDNQKRMKIVQEIYKYSGEEAVVIETLLPGV